MNRGTDLAGAQLEVRKFVVRVAGEIGEVIGEGLVGVYLLGSLAMGAFRPHTSDIDLLVLTEQKLSPAHREQLARTILALSKQRPIEGDLEIIVVQARHLKTFAHPVPVELHYSADRKAAMESGRFDYAADVGDPSVAAHATGAKQCGARLVGPEIPSVIGLIPWYAYMDAVVASYDRAGDWLERDPAGAVLNACRTLHDMSVKEITIIDKEAAARYALKGVPPEFHSTINAALEHYLGIRSAARIEPAQARALRAYVEQAAASVFDKVRDTGDDDEDEEA